MFNLVRRNVSPRRPFFFVAVLKREYHDLPRRGRLVLKSGGARRLTLVVPPGPSAVADGRRRIDVFYRRPNGHLWTNWWDGRLWSAPTDLGGVELSSEPAAIAGGP